MLRAIRAECLLRNDTTLPPFPSASLARGASQLRDTCLGSATAGMVSRISCHPLDTAKVRRPGSRARAMNHTRSIQLLLQQNSRPFCPFSTFSHLIRYQYCCYEVRVGSCDIHSQNGINYCFLCRHRRSGGFFFARD